MFPYFLTHLKAKDDAGNQQAKERTQWIRKTAISNLKTSEGSGHWLVHFLLEILGF